MNKAYLSIGSNLGMREENLNSALDFIATLGKLKQKSTIYETEAWGYIDENKYLNMSILLETNLEAVDLLKKLLTFEEKCGRKRNALGYESRIIDLDILLFNNVIIHSESLIVPHPKMTERKFILKTLWEISPTTIHPEKNKSIEHLLENCKDTLVVKPFACAI